MVTRNAARTLALDGELDIYARESLCERLATLAGEPRAIVDLSGVSYLDSTALNEFVRVVKEFVSRDARIVWVVPGGSNVQRVFAIAMLDRYFQLVPDLDAARHALAAT